MNTHIHLSLIHIDGNEKNTFNLIWNFEMKTLSLPLIFKVEL